MAFEMKDRLHALKHGMGDIVDETEIKIDEDEELGDVFSSVGQLSNAINEIEELIEHMKQLHNDILTSVQNQGAKTESNEAMESIKKLSRRVQAGLKRMKQEIEGVHQGPERNSAEFRIKKAQHSTLARKFHDVMSEYNQVQEEYRDKSKDRITRQLKYTGKKVTEDEVEEMLESDNLQIFTQDILVDTAQKRQALNEVEARHMEIIQLEANIRELYDMFLDMATLVEEQGEMIDVIEHNVEHAADFVRKGQQETRQAVRYQQSGRRLRWIICIIVSVITGVLLLVIIIGIAIGVCANTDKCG
jgi:t-SNARE complex subunit (syntaxin)